MGFPRRSRHARQQGAPFSTIPRVNGGCLSDINGIRVLQVPAVSGSHRPTCSVALSDLGNCRRGVMLEEGREGRGGEGMLHMVT